MLRWKVRYTPMLVSLTLIAAALANALGGDAVNWGW